MIQLQAAKPVDRKALKRNENALQVLLTEMRTDLNLQV